MPLFFQSKVYNLSSPFLYVRWSLITNQSTFSVRKCGRQHPGTRGLFVSHHIALTSNPPSDFQSKFKFRFSIGSVCSVPPLSFSLQLSCISPLSSFLPFTILSCMLLLGPLYPAPAAVWLWIILRRKVFKGSKMTCFYTTRFRPSLCVCVCVCLLELR